MPSNSTPDKALVHRRAGSSPVKGGAALASRRPTDRFSLIERRQLCGYFERQDPTFKKQRMRYVWQDLDDLFVATSLELADNDFAEALQLRRKSEPSHKKLSKIFGKLMNAENPFAAEFLTNLVVSEIAAQVRGKWERRTPPSESALRRLQKRDVTLFSPSEVDDVRRAAERLAIYHENMSANQTSRRNDLDTLLVELADIFARHTRFEWDRFELGKAERSRFIQFAKTALTSFFDDTTEISPNALYSRWQRLRRENRKLAQDESKPFTPKPRAPSNRWKSKRKLTSNI